MSLTTATLTQYNPNQIVISLAKPGNNHPFKVLKATEEDSEDIAHIVNSAFKQAYAFRPEGSERVSSAEVRKDIQSNNNFQWFVLKECGSSGKIAKTISTVLYTSESALLGSIHMFATRLGENGRGAGEYLYKQVEKRAENEVMALKCVDTDGLVGYYRKKLGFEKTGHHEKYDYRYMTFESANKITVCEMAKSLKCRFSKSVFDITAISSSLLSVTIEKTPDAVSDLHTLGTVKRFRALNELDLSEVIEEGLSDWGKLSRSKLPPSLFKKKTYATESSITTIKQQKAVEKLFAKDDFFLEVSKSSIFVAVKTSKHVVNAEETAKADYDEEAMLAASIKAMSLGIPASTATLELIE